MGSLSVLYSASVVSARNCVDIRSAKLLTSAATYLDSLFSSPF